MINCQLKLHFKSEACGPAVAWYIPGGQPSDWLAELIQWNVPLVDVRLHPVPSSRETLEPAGVLVTINSNAQPQPTRRSQPYRSLSGRLYLPVASTLAPPVTEAELSAMLGSSETDYVWHPTIGLIAFEPSDWLRVADLLSPPDVAPSDWSQGEPGMTFNDRLFSVEAECPMSFEAILEAGRDDIGSESSSLDSLPPGSGESPQQPGGVGDSIRKSLGRAIMWFTQKAPRTAGQQTWVDRLESWVGQNLLRISDELAERRNREIARLMKLLHQDPDEGLKFALPMDGLNAPRGVAPPSGSLGSREVDFSFNFLQGQGGPADYWVLSAQQTIELMRRYRELAEREIRLGRYRRAAYVYAHLLGDLEAAANVLIQGRHFREAAVLLKDRLSRPRKAAECLEQGGLLHEAIEIYVTLEEWQRTGLLYRRLDETELAREAFLKAAQQCRGRGDYLAAANLYEKELDDADEAVHTLEAGWESSGQSEACLSELFALYGRLARHDQARKKIDSLKKRPLDHFRKVAFIKRLAELTEGYPHEPLRPFAADTARLLVSEELLTGKQPQIRRDALNALSRIDSSDRLHRRDCHRYLTHEKAKRSQDADSYRLRQRIDRPTFMREIPPPHDADWVRAVAAGKSFYLAGFAGKRLDLLRGHWTHAEPVYHGISWRLEGNHSRRDLLLAPHFRDDAPPYVAITGHPPLPRRWLTGVTGLTPDWLQELTLGLTRSPNDVAWAIHDDGNAQVTLSAYFQDRLISSQVLNWIAPDFDPDEITLSDDVFQIPFSLPFPMVSDDRNLWIAIGQSLFRRDNEGENTQLIFNSPILDIRASLPRTTCRIAVLFENAVRVRWESDDVEKTVATEFNQPVADFIANGQLVIADQNELQVYSTTDNQLRMITSLPLARRPIAVLRIPRAKYFALANADGSVHLYQF